MQSTIRSSNATSSADPLVTIRQGSLPWAPGGNDEEFDAEYDFYDIPLMGVVRRGEHEFLFRCVGGDLEQVSIWKYSHIGTEARALLDAAEGEGFLTAAKSALTGYGTVALYVEGHGLVARAVHEEQSVFTTSEVVEMIKTVPEILRITPPSVPLEDCEVDSSPDRTKLAATLRDTELVGC